MLYDYCCMSYKRLQVCGGTPIAYIAGYHMTSADKMSLPQVFRFLVSYIPFAKYHYHGEVFYTTDKGIWAFTTCSACSTCSVCHSKSLFLDWTNKLQGSRKRFPPTVGIIVSHTQTHSKQFMKILDGIWTTVWSTNRRPSRRPSGRPVVSVSKVLHCRTW